MPTSVICSRCCRRTDATRSGESWCATQADRDEVARMLLGYRDEIGREWADIVDLLTMHPDTPASKDARAGAV